MPVTAREAALRAVALYRRRGLWPEMLLDSLITSEKMDVRDASLASNIAGGVMRNTALLDFYISQYLNCRSSKLEPAVQDILRISAYQLIFLDRVPAHAAVSEGVALAKKHANPRAASLVNAVLRRISAERNNLPQIPSENKTEYLSVKYSHPAWLVGELSERLGYDGCEELLAVDNEVPPVTVQVNTLKCTADEAKAALLSDGVTAESHPFLPDAFMISHTGALNELSSFRKGYLYVQDAAARLAAMCADVKPGDTVLDGCAAPGGKSFAAAVQMNNEGRIISCDLHENKLVKISDGADRLGISIIETLAADGRKPYAGLFGAADCVFADVPCSGMGVIRKKPDIRYKKPEELSLLPQIQLDILRGLSKCVKPGGTLVYSTCTVLRQENEEVCRGFLRENGDFEAADFSLPCGNSDGGMLTLWPHIHGTDGFFICRMKRKK